SPRQPWPARVARPPTLRRYPRRSPARAGRAHIGGADVFDGRARPPTGAVAFEALPLGPALGEILVDRNRPAGAVSPLHAESVAVHSDETQRPPIQSAARAAARGLTCHRPPHISLTSLTCEHCEGCEGERVVADFDRANPLIENTWFFRL